ncbi:lactate dehydrogenase [Propionigenium maris DSM 9537]|uniref:Lactate dehydrogenase n=1 Tax=Propionigenium maris DSM 9537 TaxID=1123000 RepID=A0A9W6GJK1_9FUSO|nr:NAD(P)-dependent oxidoreductase [Propionigenium maris]GLI55297.1 lactate dehydrogenase [Propionigenium maris DSM 9537]
MAVNLVCYGVRDVETEYFNSLNKYGYRTTYVGDLLNTDNLHLIEGNEAVMLRGNCPADAKNIEKMAGYGVKYLLTRTVGYNHIDVEAAKKHGMKVARVPGYSPNAIAELALTLAMMLLRNTAYTVHRTRKKDFRADAQMFSPEIRRCTVGIVGTGRIGLTAAKLFKGLGARVIAYDLYPSKAAADVVEYLPMEEVVAQSDIISLHCPYIKDSNHYLVDDEFIGRMKTGAILINTARGELQDIEAVIRGLESGKLGGFGTDVLEGESEVFFRDLRDQELTDRNIEKLTKMFPKVIITPHIGSYTDEALTNMVEISYDNLNDLLTRGRSENEL